VPKFPMGLHVLVMKTASARVLYEALEAHKEGLEEAREHVTVDPTLETAEDLTVVTGSIQEDITLCIEMMENLDVRDRH
jgi:hypothetical protein